MVENDKVLEQGIDDMTKSREYQEYMKFLSEDFFSKNEDFFTQNLYAMGTAAQRIDENYVEHSAYSQFKRYMRRLCFDALPQFIFIIRINRILNYHQGKTEIKMDSKRRVLRMLGFDSDDIYITLLLIL
jgi:hypothetical protein